MLSGETRHIFPLHMRMGKNDVMFNCNIKKIKIVITRVHDNLTKKNSVNKLMMN